MQEVSFSNAIENNMVVSVSSKLLKKLYIKKANELPECDRSFLHSLIFFKMPYEISGILKRFYNLCNEDSIEYLTLLLDCKWFLD